MVSKEQHPGQGTRTVAMAHAVEITSDVLVIEWAGGGQDRIPLERITWVSEQEDPYDSPYFDRPTFVTVHYLNRQGMPAAVTLTRWQAPHDLVNAIVRAREIKLAGNGRITPPTTH